MQIQARLFEIAAAAARARRAFGATFCGLRMHSLRPAKRKMSPGAHGEPMICIQMGNKLERTGEATDSRAQLGRFHRNWSSKFACANRRDCFRLAGDCLCRPTTGERSFVADDLMAKLAGELFAAVQSRRLPVRESERPATICATSWRRPTGWLTGSGGLTGSPTHTSWLSGRLAGERADFGGDEIGFLQSTSWLPERPNGH